MKIEKGGRDLKKMTMQKEKDRQRKNETKRILLVKVMVRMWYTNKIQNVNEYLHSNGREKRRGNTKYKKWRIEIVEMKGRHKNKRNNISRRFEFKNEGFYHLIRNLMLLETSRFAVSFLVLSVFHFISLHFIFFLMFSIILIYFS